VRKSAHPPGLVVLWKQAVIPADDGRMLADFSCHLIADGTARKDEPPVPSTVHADQAAAGPHAT
jgi:hypothetical protein